MSPWRLNVHVYLICQSGLIFNKCLFYFLQETSNHVYLVMEVSSQFLFLKCISHKTDVAPIYLLIRYLHLFGSKYFSRCFNMSFPLVYLYFEVNFYILIPFEYSSSRRRWNGATSFGPCYLLLTLGI